MADTEILLGAQMRRADEITIADGVPGLTLMERAGAAVARAAEALAGRHGAEPGGVLRVLVLCGPGNNGGDGFIAARILAESGHKVTLALLGSRDRLGGDAVLAARSWSGPVAAIADACLDQADLVIDALFGTGLSRDLDGEARDLIERLNATGKPVLAVDIPSGINGDTGNVCGVAVRAAATVTFARRKPAHLLLPGPLHCGHVEVADIGIAQATIRACADGISANGPGLWGDIFPKPTLDSHKYKRGHALVVSGGALSTGAARLSARAALRAGAGLVTLASPPDAVMINAAHLTAVMLRPMDGANGLAELLADTRLNALVIGPGAGVGAATRALAEVAARHQRASVLDADAITSFAGDLPGLRRVIESAGDAAIVMTPHDGEFARLFRDEPMILNAPSKLERARLGARASGAVMVLKGADTVIAAPDGRAAINDNAPPWLGTAGSGDVLSGIIAGLLAQGMPGFEAAAAGVWLHGAAGSICGAGLISEDLPEALPRVLTELLAVIS